MKTPDSNPPTPFLVTLLISWSKSPYAWTSPLDSSGDYEKVVKVWVDDLDLLSKEELEKELLRLTTLEVETISTRGLSVDNVKVLSHEKL